MLVWNEDYTALGVDELIIYDWALSKCHQQNPLTDENLLEPIASQIGPLGWCLIISSKEVPPSGKEVSL